MRKLRQILMILILLLLTACGRKVTIEEAEQALHNHLIKRFGEEFAIGFGGRRGYTVEDRKVRWYEFEITPLSYDGTNKIRDSYYDCKGTVILKEDLFGEKIETTGDTYGSILLKEQANDFYGKKLKELFGENVLPVLEITGSYSVKNKTFLENVILTQEKNNSSLYVKGGIYIFGRVENDEDREWYRKQIYEFIQFMKQTGTFEYVKLDFSIIDERIITNEFISKNLQQEILTIYEKALNNEITGEEFKEKRRKILSEIKVPYNLSKNKLDEWNKGNIISIDDKLGMASTILFSKIITEKFITSNEYFYKDYSKKSYDKIEDIKLDY